MQSVKLCQLQDATTEAEIHFLAPYCELASLSQRDSCCTWLPQLSVKFLIIILDVATCCTFPFPYTFRKLLCAKSSHPNNVKQSLEQPEHPTLSYSLRGLL